MAENHDKVEYYAKKLIVLLFSLLFLQTFYLLYQSIKKAVHLAIEIDRLPFLDHSY